MGPPRPIVATLEGHHAVVKGRQDLLRSTKFLYCILTSTSETRPRTPILCSSFWRCSFKRERCLCSVTSPRLCVLSCSSPAFGTRLCFSKASPPSTHPPNMNSVLGGGDSGRKAGRSADRKVTSDLSGLSPQGHPTGWWQPWA